MYESNRKKITEFVISLTISYSNDKKRIQKADKKLVVKKELTKNVETNVIAVGKGIKLMMKKSESNMK